jgi:para-aminobenzoate synthetase / 4-amino-4-deoxychorismate lyase
MRASSRDVFALLDDASSAAGEGRSRLYTGYVRRVVCHDRSDLDTAWAQVEQAQSEGLHALVLADYDWGVRLQGVRSRHDDGSAALRVLLFRRCTRAGAAAVGRWLARREADRNRRITSADLAEVGAVALRGIEPALSEAAFTHALTHLHEAIRQGESYQVNFTFGLDMTVGGDPVALYRRLRARQPVAFGALIALPSDDERCAAQHILSFSPELFLRHERDQLTAKPMKGTAPRHVDPASDLLAHEQLASAKSRAENLMIVDLLRNDLGRIARIGSVRVPALFEVEAHATVWQMTSTITAQRASGVRFPDVLRALFPCGSITGAPKHRTMQIIDALESAPRGVYCGAIGWIDAPSGGQECPDFCLCVPIRTLTLGAPAHGWRAAHLGIGAGIVADSTAASEYAECLLKARFLTGLESGFALIETMHLEARVVRHIERHLARLTASAKALGFAPAQCDIEELIAQTVAGFSRSASPQRLRLLRFPDGTVKLSSAPLEALADEPFVTLASTAFETSAWPLAHKTTVRAPYDAALKRAQSVGAFDELQFNERGELTEGARSNVFVRLPGSGEWLTPALHCGVLPGVMRGVLLDDPTFCAREAVITLDDVAHADEIALSNALRGLVRVHLLLKGG